MFRIIAILLVASTLSGVEGPQENPAAAGLDQQQHQLVDFALERFANAGLELPSDLKISFPTDQAKCFGYGGIYVPTEVEVRICRPSDTTMVHELAHAWLETTLTDEERKAFLELRGLNMWAGGDEWDQRGAEQSAEILTWALMDRDITVRWLVPGPNSTPVETFRLFKIENSTYEELVAAYQLLTGSDPVDRNSRSLAVETVSDLSSPEARRSGPTLTSDEQEVVDWACGRFDIAGLELPDIAVRFDPTRELCRNNEGLYRREPGGIHQVFVCTRDSETFAAELERRRTLLHEFGHVWDTVNLNDEQRGQLSYLLGTSDWYDQEADWSDRGVERFAESFVLSLLDQPARHLKVDTRCADLIAAFTAATAAVPLGPGEPWCLRVRAFTTNRGR